MHAASQETTKHNVIHLSAGHLSISCVTTGIQGIVVSVWMNYKLNTVSPDTTNQHLQQQHQN